jgi:hypothetical protein
MKEIPGFPGYYATREGVIITIRTNPSKVLKQRLHKGYYHVFVKTGLGRSTKKKMPVHQLVLIAYKGPKQEGQVGRHFNGNPLDNHADNLMWGTTADNVQDSIKHRTSACLRIGEQSNCSKLKEIEVREIKRLVDAGVYQSVLAKRFNVSQKHISDIKLGRTWRHVLGA